MKYLTICCKMFLIKYMLHISLAWELILYTIQYGLFIFQLSLAIYFGIGQCTKMLESTLGLSPTMFLAFLISMVINLYLAFTNGIKDNKKKKDWFIIYIYTTWTFVMSMILIFYWNYGTFSELDIQNEIKMCLIILSGIIILFAHTKHKKRGLRHPYTKGYLSGILKSFPQVMLIPIAYNKGVDGWNEGTIWVGHITITIRITLLLLGKRGKKYTDEDKAIIYAELANSISWIAFHLVFITLK